MKKIKIIALTLVMAGLFFISTFSYADSTIKIGILGPMTGGSSMMGQGQRDGVLLYIDQINKAGGIAGKKLEGVVMDDRGEVTLSINAVKKLLFKDEVIAVIGTPNSPVCLATMDITEKEKTPQLLMGASPKLTEKPDNKWFVRITPSDVIMASNFVDFIVKDKGLKKLAILHDSSDYGKGGKDAVMAKMKKYGLEPVAVESFNVGDKDFAAQLNKIKTSKADAIVLWGLYIESAQILIQAKQYGLTLPVFGSSGVLQGAFLTLAGAAAEDLYIVTYFSTDNPDPKVQKFIKEYKSKFGIVPTPTAALAYDCATVLGDAIKEAGTNKEAIMAKLRSIKNKSGVIGRIESDPSGQLGQGAVIMQVKKGKTVVVKSVN
jgi:branched-chain amino acid transport system substrate-binding protein